MGFRVSMTIVPAAWPIVMRALSDRYGPIAPANAHAHAAPIHDHLRSHRLEVARYNGYSLVDDRNGCLAGDADLAGELALRIRSVCVTILAESITDTYQLIVADHSGLRTAFFYSGEQGVGPIDIGPDRVEPTGSSTDWQMLVEHLSKRLGSFDLIDAIEQGDWSPYELRRTLNPTPGAVAVVLDKHAALFGVRSLFDLLCKGDDGERSR